MATVLDIADAVAAKIVEWWRPQYPDCAERVYLPDVTEPGKLKGRKVYVWPSDYGQADVATRALDRNSFTIGVEIVERYADTGRPSREWCDERVQFGADLWQLLGDARAVPLFETVPDAYSMTADVTLVFDPDLLREKSLFWSGLTLTYEKDE